MGVQERLSLQAVAEPTLLASEHLQRYEFAAGLCCGLRVLDLCCGSGYGSAILAARAASVHGVDNDAATIDLAVNAVGGESISFELADATEFVRTADLAARFDAIVCFEGLEHLPEPFETLAALRRHAAAGVTLIASIPNSRGMHEQNEFHLSDFGYAEAHAAFAEFAEFADGVIVHQYLAEGSLIVVDDGVDIGCRLYGLERAEPPYANHFMLVSGVARQRLGDAHEARMQLAAAPTYNRYMRTLERANTELRRRNNQLTRGLLGKADSAGGAFLKRAEADRAEVARLRLDVVELKGELDLRQRHIRRLEEQLEDARESAQRTAAAMHSAAAGGPVTRVVGRLARALSWLRG